MCIDIWICICSTKYTVNVDNTQTHCYIEYNIQYSDDHRHRAPTKKNASLFSNAFCAHMIGLACIFICSMLMHLKLVLFIYSFIKNPIGSRSTFVNCDYTKIYSVSSHVKWKLNKMILFLKVMWHHSDVNSVGTRVFEFKYALIIWS